MRLVAVIAFLVGCKASGTFTCETASQCGPNARCEDNHFCSFADEDCSSGWRYDDYAGGGIRGQCVGDQDVDAGLIDARVDAGPVDAKPDAMPAPGCPAGYLVVGSLSGGYRYISSSDDWLAAEQDCENDGSGTHLVVIGGGTERSAIKDFANENSYWIGVSDRLAEGTYRTVVDTIQTYLPWDTSQPTGVGQNCVYANDSNFSDDDCNQQRRYVCECDGVAPVPASY